MSRLSEDWWAVILGVALVMAVCSGILALPWDKW